MLSIEAIGSSICRNATHNILDCDHQLSPYAAIAVCSIALFALAYSLSSCNSLCRRPLTLESLTTYRHRRIIHLRDNIERQIHRANTLKELFDIAQELFGMCNETARESIEEIPLLRTLFLGALAGEQIDRDLITSLLRTGAPKLQKEHIQPLHFDTQHHLPPGGPTISISVGDGHRLLKDFFASNAYDYTLKYGSRPLNVNEYAFTPPIEQAVERAIPRFEYPKTLNAYIQRSCLTYRENQPLLQKGGEKFFTSHTTEFYFRNPRAVLDGESLELIEQVALKALQLHLPKALSFEGTSLSPDQIRIITNLFESLQTKSAL